MPFSDFSLIPQLTRSLAEREYVQPTPVQAATIGPALAGEDLVVTAETGSGKTAAFILPLIDRLHRNRTTTVAGLVLAPTRELAAQVGGEFKSLARHTRLKAAVVVGGESMSRQVAQIKRGVQVVIACPGRLIDHVEQGIVDLGKIEVLIIDEADRLLDMGFLPQLRRIVRMLPKRRQTLMFSATMGPAVELIAREFLVAPKRVSVGTIAMPPTSIRQAIYATTTTHKMPMLLEIVKRADLESAIVFTRTRSRAESLGRHLVRSGVKAVALHGDRSQSQRNAALAGFRNGDYRVLVATDVAARGLDIEGVSHVINYDLPDEVESYVHRIGRTARMGRAGEALSLVTTEDRVSLSRIERSLGIELERRTLPGFETPELTTLKPVTLFRSLSSPRTPRARPRLRWA